MQVSEPDDAAIILRSHRAPEEFAALFDRHAPHIHRYLARRLGDQVADDLVAETFLTAFRRRDTFWPGPHDARPWLYGIATNLVAQHRRDEARALRLRHAVAPDPDSFCHADQVAADVTAAALRDALTAALATLADGDRDVLLLIAQEELTYEQVAVALDIPVGTVRSRLHRARTALKAALGGHNPLTFVEEEVRHG
ncbi:RNA polymerase sigma70 factor [Actinoplanes sp. SE50]|uniref:RNA polymerase sigma factor n=1 Tax=unclassified Actinoplanes TaxID=2626549 RepID=UPI00023ED159|nr:MULTISPECIES: RNA polymerase sigma factor [unclassified Actinoplanes]AEV81088.1 RNA polymerase sigma-E factor [Actinoplanes sp. SE50/110]ATO79489.1 RNA polymerase sigma70 factor [Actinoplanes sp. SE50]SLL96889.1 DNA-directed RNA polymerase sigma-70 factor [Actinoplanes sp. SE50/110]